MKQKHSAGTAKATQPLLYVTPGIMLKAISALK